ncbi:hypothetical protein B7494_g673 [Chlorociboria aeruginascens]|nr:hypothetical protein B7494_g673 [Chlorociboria aeruginascens]
MRLALPPTPADNASPSFCLSMVLFVVTLAYNPSLVTLARSWFLLVVLLMVLGRGSGSWVWLVVLARYPGSVTLLRWLTIDSMLRSGIAIIVDVTAVVLAASTSLMTLFKVLNVSGAVHMAMDGVNGGRDGNMAILTIYRMGRSKFYYTWSSKRPISYSVASFKGADVDFPGQDDLDLETSTPSLTEDAIEAVEN